MRGSPTWQVILVTVMFALAGVPVWRLTQPSTVAAVSNTDTPVSPTDPDRKTPQVVEVRAEFAPPPRDFQIHCLDQTVLEGQGPNASFTTRWSTILPTEGVDLVVRANWNIPGPSAARVTARFADGRRIEKSFWAATDGSLAEVFTVPGSSPSP